MSKDMIQDDKNYSCGCDSVTKHKLCFLREHIDKLDWGEISWNRCIPVEFFREHIDKLDWEGISRNESLPLEFFRKHIDKLDWKRVSPKSIHKNLIL